MSLLQEIIALLNKEDIRSYKLLANRTNASEGRKDLFLFNEIKKQKTSFNERSIISSLYHNNKNAYFRLKNRLIKDIEKSQILQHGFKSSDIYNVLQLLLAKIFYEKQAFKLAAVYLQKAEKKALQQNDHSLLELIYKELLRLSHNLSAIDVVALIKKKKENRQKLQQIQEFDEIIAAARYKINTTQSFSHKNKSIIDLLEQTIKTYSKNTTIANTPKLQIQMYQAISRVLLQQSNYKALEEYLIHSYKKFQKTKLFNKKNHDLKLELIVFIINSLFKNNKSKESLKYTDLLVKEMERFDRVYYDKYLFFYYNSLVINNSKENKKSAISFLLKAKKEAPIQAHSDHLLFIEINLMQLYFDVSDFKSAIKISSRIPIKEAFLNLNKTYQLKLMLAELIIRFEIGDFDLLEYRLSQIKKDYKKQLNNPVFKRELMFVQLILDLTVTNNIRYSKEIEKKANLFLSLISDKEADDRDVININFWLKKKIT